MQRRRNTAQRAARRGWLIASSCLAAWGCESLAGLGDFVDETTTASGTTPGGSTTTTGTTTGGGGSSGAGGHAGGSAGTGGSGGGTPSNCGTNLNHLALVFYSTLDDLAAVTSPVVGSGQNAQVVTTPENDFVSQTPCDGGIQIDQAAEFVSFPEQATWARGTLALWYLPQADTLQAPDKHLFATNAGATSPRIRVGFLGNSSPNPGFVVRILDGNGGMAETRVIESTSQLPIGTWIHIRVTWDTNAAEVDQNVHVYFDDIEPTYAAASTGAITPNPGANKAVMYFGAWDGTDPGVAHGVLDDVMLWSDVVPP